MKGLAKTFRQAWDRKNDLFTAMTLLCQTNLICAPRVKGFGVSFTILPCERGCPVRAGAKIKSLAYYIKSVCSLFVKIELVDEFLLFFAKIEY